MKIDVKGINKVVRNIESYSKETINGVEQKVQEAGVKVESEAISRTPVGQYDDGRVGGNLKANWNREVLDGGLTVEIFNPVEYGMYVEMGTYKMSAQPMLRPSFELIRPRLYRDLERVLRR